MSINKKGEFLKDEIALSDFARSLGHPARIAILKTIAESNECICGEIVEVMPLSQSTVSQHLKELKRIGLIKGSLNGAKSAYCINWETFEAYMSQFNELATELISQRTANLACTK